RLGLQRQQRVCMHRTLLDKGFLLGGGSDASVTPISPFRGIASAMNHYNAAERISLYEGLKMFTSDAARFTFEENEKGTLEIGKLGDVAIIEGNIHKMDHSDMEAMDNIKFLYTIVEGEIKYKG
ncbi:MAG: amidohydrolase family protein, partial [Firmicutes bacterium]|nr:amidohydrolase family protein [Bacillota bacterium]